MKCANCEATIITYKSKKSKNVFCNHQCYAKHKSKNWVKENNPRWRGGDDVIKCKTCSIEFTRKKYGLNRYTYYCSRTCAGLGTNKSRDLHWNWKGGNNSRAIKKVAPRPRPDNCEVCGNEGGKRNGIVLDHNHETGKFRGWLCSNCNTALGLLKEDPQRFDLLKAYITNENSF